MITPTTFRLFLSKPVYFYSTIIFIVASVLGLYALNDSIIYIFLGIFGLLILLLMIYFKPFPITCLWIFLSPLLIVTIPSPSGLPTFYATQHFFFIIFFIFSLKSILQKKTALSYDITDTALFLFIPLSIFSTLLNFTRMYTIDWEVLQWNSWGFTLVMMMIMIYILFSRQTLSKEQLKGYIITMVLSSSIVSIWGIYSVVKTGQTVDIFNRAGTGALWAGFLGTFLGIFLPIILSFFIGYPTKKYRLIFIPILTILMIGLVYSFARSAWIGVLAGMSFIIFMYNRKMTVFLFLSIVLTILFSPTVLNLIENFIRKYYTTEGVFYTNVRIDLWKYVLGIIQEHWIFGHGLGGFAYSNTLIYIMGDRLGAAHNNYLELLVEMGVLGLFLFLIFLISLIKHGIQVFLKDSDPFYRCLSIGIVGSIIHAMCAMSFQESVFVCAANGGQIVLLGMAYYWILFGLLVNIYRQRMPNRTLTIQKVQDSIVQSPIPA